MSFLARDDPGRTPYCMGERAGGGGAVAAIVADMGGVGPCGGAGVGVTAGGSGRGLGIMCFKRLFL